MNKKGIGVYGIGYKACTLLIPLYLYTSIPLSAQEFKAGLIGGIATSQVDGDTWGGYNKAGFLAGGFVAKRFSPESKWCASFEITYIQKGSRKHARPDKGDYTIYKLDLNYAEVPLLVSYDFGFADSSDDGRMNFTLFGGLAVGALVYSKEEDTFGPVSGGTPFQKTDVSTILGLRYMLSEHIGFDIRTEYSALPVRRGGTSSYYQNWTFKFLRPGYYNNLVLFSIRYRL